MSQTGSKELVFWGIGGVCAQCEKWNPEVTPSFYIDNTQDVKYYNGRCVKKPSDIDEWNKLYIVVTSTAFFTIEKYLMEIGLCEGENYIWYVDFFRNEDGKIESTVKDSMAFINNNPEYIGSTFIFADLFYTRDSTDSVNFYKNYALKRPSEKMILWTCFSTVSIEKAKKELGFPVFNIPKLCQMDKILSEKNEIAEPENIKNIKLDIDEDKWIIDSEKWKINTDKDKAVLATKEIFWYYKRMIEIFRPKKMIIWGCWQKKSIILDYLGRKYRIQYGYMDHGWIPGTYWFIQGGGSQKKYVIEPINLEAKPMGYSCEEISQIKNYIIKTKLDSRIFKETDEDRKELIKIDPKKRTVFLIGMDDNISTVQSGSIDWKECISPIFNSMKETVEYISTICHIHDWNLVFKPHPHYDYANVLSVKNTDDIIQVKNTSVDYLIEIADIVVSLASNVNYKALIYEKPLLQMGHTSLDNKGCAYEPKCREEIENMMVMAMERGMSAEQKKSFDKHLSQILSCCLWDNLAKREIRYGLKPDVDFFET